MSPDEVAVAPGETVTVDVYLLFASGVDSLTGYRIDLSEEATGIDIQTTDCDPADARPFCEIWTIGLGANTDPGRHDVYIEALDESVLVGTGEFTIFVCPEGGEPLQPDADWDPCTATGACCDPSTNTCTDYLAESACQDTSLQWTEGTRCNDLSPPCPTDAEAITGACCWSSDCSEMDQSECSRDVGDWKGYGTTCDPNPCPQPAVEGACCVDSTCFLFEEVACDDSGGTYLGDNEPCAPNPCQ